VPGLTAEMEAKSREKWAADVAKLVALNEENAGGKDAVLFVGSSSIRRWESLAEDLAPIPTVRRGLGGSRYVDWMVFGEEIMQGLTFNRLMVFVGNGMSGEGEDPPVEQIVSWFKHLAAMAERLQPGVKVYCIEVTPCRKRWDIWPGIQKTNAALKQVCESHPQWEFVETGAQFLGEDGLPVVDLFVADELHLSEKGYQIWIDAFKEILLKP
jgi:hypothetical protein